MTAVCCFILCPLCQVSLSRRCSPPGENRSQGVTSADGKSALITFATSPHFGSHQRPSHGTDTITHKINKNPILQTIQKIFVYTVQYKIETIYAPIINHMQILTIS